MIQYLPYVFFIASGACSLVYEVAWSRYLGLLFGNTTLAHMCVLAGFMGGLALGSLAAGALVSRLRRPLLVYGLVEIAIGAYAAAFPHFIQPVQSRALAAASGLEIGGPAWIGLKLAVSAAVMLPPTVLMGATFPVLVRNSQPNTEGGQTEWLYAANCAGAVFGSLIAGFALIPILGLSATLTVVGLINATLGAAAATLGFASSAVTEPARKQSDAPVPVKNASAWPVYLAIAFSGLTAMVYELVWIRIFAVVLGSSTYSFTLMVAAFITGIALGSAAVGVSRWAKRHPLATFAVAEAAIGLAVAVSIPLYERLPYAFWVWSSQFVRAENTVWVHSIVKYFICFLVMVVPTFFFGMTLPLAIKSTGRGDRVASDAGFIYGANTLGTLAGAIATGLLLIPVVGLRGSLGIALIMNVGIGAWLLWLSGIPYGRLAAFGAVVAGIGIVAISPAWNPAGFAHGTCRARGTPPPTWAGYEEMWFKRPILFQGQDGVATVAVMETPNAGRGRSERTLMVDGKADASAYGDMPTQVLIAQIPMLLKPDAREVLVVGLGGGATTGSVLTHPGARVDCAEISPAVARAAQCFRDVNHDVLRSPRLKLIVEDARTFVQATPKRYDVIINQPSNPWVAGEGNLFSVEYFRSIDRVLKPGGIVIQWFHTYEINDDLVAVILRSLRRVFPRTCLFQGATNDYIVVASREPLAPDFTEMERRMRVESVRDDMDRVSIDSVTALLGRQVLSPQGVARIAGAGRVNTDDLPILEFSAPVAQYVGAEAGAIARADERPRGGKGLLSSDYLRSHPLDRATCRSLVRMFSDPRMRDPALRMRYLRYYVSRWPDAWSTGQYARLTGKRLERQE